MRVAGQRLQPQQNKQPAEQSCGEPRLQSVGPTAIDPRTAAPPTRERGFGDRFGRVWLATSDRTVDVPARNRSPLLIFFGRLLALLGEHGEAAWVSPGSKIVKFQWEYQYFSNLARINSELFLVHFCFFLHQFWRFFAPFLETSCALLEVGGRPFLDSG